MFKAAALPLLALVFALPAAAQGSGQTAAAPQAQVYADPGAFTNLPAAPAPEAFTPATQAEVAAALRADALTQSAFFANQFDHDPSNVQMGLYLSNALRALGRYSEAADTAHSVLLFAPDNVDVLIAAARAHIEGNDAFQAIYPLQHVIQLKPNDWLPHSLLGVAYDQVKRPDDAQTEWATALRMSPNNPAVLSNVAMSKVTAGDIAGAEPLLRTAAAQPGASIQVRQNLALVLGLEGKLADAEKLLRQDLPPDQADAALAWLEHAVAARTSTASADPAPGASPARAWATVQAAGG